MSQLKLKAFNSIRASTPGRIVLFGEHQDYFHLPVIAAGINLRINIQGNIHDKPRIHLILKNLRRTYTFPLQFPLKYHFRRAYLQSAMNLLTRKGFRIPPFEATIQGSIPQNAGLSSSSALTVAWIQFLVELMGEKISKENIAQWAYEAEVIEFNEPGGPQDHFATALGNLHYLQFPFNQSPKFDPIDTSKLANIAFVIGNSQVKKRTLSMLRRIKYHVFTSMRLLELENLDTISLSKIPSDNAHKVLRAILKTRDLTQEGIKLFKSTKKEIPISVLGNFLSTQHLILRDELKLSIPRVESIIQGAMRAGAYGCKINGSGGGGCIIAICDPKDTIAVTNAIKKGKGFPYQVSIDTGVRVENLIQ